MLSGTVLDLVFKNRRIRNINFVALLLLIALYIIGELTLESEQPWSATLTIATWLAIVGMLFIANALYFTRQEMFTLRHHWKNSLIFGAIWALGMLVTSLSAPEETFREYGIGIIAAASVIGTTFGFICYFMCISVFSFYFWLFGVLRIGTRDKN